MSDEDVRQADRVAQVGDVQDQAAALVARVRAGTLDPAMATLAQVCGHEPALLAFPCRHDDIQDGDRACACWYGRMVTTHPVTADTMVRWSSGLRPFGKKARVAAALAAQRYAFAAWKAAGGEKARTDAAELVIQAAEEMFEAGLIDDLDSAEAGVMLDEIVVRRRLLAKATIEGAPGTLGPRRDNSVFSIEPVLTNPGAGLAAILREADAFLESLERASTLTLLSGKQPSMTQTARGLRAAVRDGVLAWALR